MSSSNIVSLNEARRFIIDCFIALNCPKNHGEQMADLLIEADYRGHFSHGMNRLQYYCNDLKNNSINSNILPEILKQTPATAWVDGRNGLGAVVGNFCMDLAIEMASKIGVGVVCAKGSNHYGIAGWYTIRAEKKGFIGISMTNTSPALTPTRSKNAALGTNPISFAAPGKLNGNVDDSFVLDMATTAVALGKVEVQKRKNQSIPNGWSLDENGEITTDSQKALNACRLLPLGGMEETSGYKGYGLATMVEILCGILGDGNFATNIRRWGVGDNSEHLNANLGQFFMALDPNCFAPGFRDRVSEQNQILRNMPSVDPEKPVLVAGDPERINMAKINEQGGIIYVTDQINTCNKLAVELNVKPIQFIEK